MPTGSKQIRSRAHDLNDTWRLSLDFYRCNICYYQTKNPQEIMKHIQEEMTKIDKQRSTKTAYQFETPIFLFDDRLRGKLCFL